MSLGKRGLFCIIVLVFLAACTAEKEETPEPTQLEQDIAQGRPEPEENITENVTNTSTYTSKIADEIISLDKSFFIQPYSSTEPDEREPANELRFRLREISVSKTHPTLEFYFTSEEEFAIYFMEDLYENIEAKYVEQFASGAGVSYDGWLSEFRMEKCKSFNKPSEEEYETGEYRLNTTVLTADQKRQRAIDKAKNKTVPPLNKKIPILGTRYELDGSCMAYLPGGKGWLIIRNEKEESGETESIKVDVRLIAKKGTPPETYPPPKNLSAVCPPRTNGCDLPWKPRGLQRAGEAMNLYKYECDRGGGVGVDNRWLYCKDEAEICNDEKDNTRNGLIDCDDPFCVDDPYC